MAEESALSSDFDLSEVVVGVFPGGAEEEGDAEDEREDFDEEFVEEVFHFYVGLKSVLGQRAAEVQADDGGQQVRIEGCDDEAVGGLPNRLGDRGSEKKAFFELGVTDDDRDLGEENGDDFGKGDDEENRDERDGAARPLESGIGVAPGAVDDAGLGGHDLELELLLLAAGHEEHAEELGYGADDGGTQEGKCFERERGHDAYMV